MRPTAATISRDKKAALAAAIDAIPDTFPEAKNKLSMCFLAVDLASIHIYTVGLLDMAKMIGYSDSLIDSLHEIRKVMES